MVACRSMRSLRQLPGYVLAIVLCGIGAAQIVVAWAGWSLGLGWPWAAVALVLSLAARFNGYALVGTFFFAQEYLHWPMPQCVALAAIGLFFLTPGVFREVMGTLTGGDVKPL